MSAKPQRQPPPLPPRAPETAPRASPPPLIERAIARVCFFDSVPGKAGSTIQASIFSSSQTTLEHHALGVVVHGCILATWANIKWVEYA